MSALSRSKPGFGGPAGVSCFGSAAKAAAAKPKVRTAKAIPRAFMMGLLLLSCCPLWSRGWDELGPCERDQGQARRAGSKIQPVGRRKRRTSEGPDARGNGREKARARRSGGESRVPWVRLQQADDADPAAREQLHLRRLHLHPRGLHDHS